MTRVSRRHFFRLGAAGAVAVPLVHYPIGAHAATVTAQDIVDRIRESVGVQWQSETVDTFKAGDPSTIVTGVVTGARRRPAPLRDCREDHRVKSIEATFATNGSLKPMTAR
jgi:hypothetical protein